MSNKIKISQCMIVKNEEHNIRRALSWGKSLMYEQIVVDTGSTDNTVAIAKEMGAKVYEIKWEDDFSKAKNYALEQASGEWIVFLDADEYIPERYLTKFKNGILQATQYNLDNREKQIEAIRTKIYNIDEQNQIVNESITVRLFKKDDMIGFKNAIHEILYHKNRQSLYEIDLNEVYIYHTGYQQEEYEKKQKGKRNISILEREIEKDPNNGELWTYLGDAYHIDIETRAKSKEAYDRAIELGNGRISMQVLAIANRIRLYFEEEEVESYGEEIEVLYRKFQEKNVIFPDIEFFMGLYYIKSQDYDKGALFLESTLELIEAYEKNQLGIPLSLMELHHMKMLYEQLVSIFYIKRDWMKMVKYGTLSLKLAPYSEKILYLLLDVFYKNKENPEGIYSFLSKLYDFNQMKDKLFVIRSEMKLKQVALKRILLATMTEEERNWYNEETNAKMREKRERERLVTKYPNLIQRTKVDYEFTKILEQLEEQSLEQLIEQGKNKFLMWESEGEKESFAYQEQIKKYPSWGKLDIPLMNYDLIEKRMSFLQREKENILQIYQSLADKRSKKVMVALLMHWLNFDVDLMVQLREREEELWDCFELRDKEVYVEIGCSTGDGIIQFIENNGLDYDKVYGFDIQNNLCEFAKDRLSCYDNLVIQRKGIGSKDGISYVETVEDKVRLTETYTNETVEMVTLDETIKENITCLNLRVCEMAYEVLCGAREQIRNNKPKIIVPVHYHIEDLIRIPQLLKEIREDYRFYLVYCGSGMLPDNFYLIAL